MPKVYLSPSLQEYNLFVDGGTEEEITNLIADAIEPYLTASGITFSRNEPSMSLSQAIAESNAQENDFHLSIHTNAAPPALAGKIQGPDVYYYANSIYGRKMSDIIAENLKKIYPAPEKVNVIPAVTLRELSRTNMPSALVEVAYHDNPEDAKWIKENIPEIGRALALSLTEYFGVPFREPKAEEAQEISQ